MVVSKPLLPLANHKSYWHDNIAELNLPIADIAFSVYQAPKKKKTIIMQKTIITIVTTYRLCCKKWSYTKRKILECFNTCTKKSYVNASILDIQKTFYFEKQR